MAIDFPNSPSINDEHSAGGKVWIFDGSKWSLKVANVPLEQNVNLNDSSLSNSFWMGV